jgi:DNA-binding PadR family transcriptional regulator
MAADSSRQSPLALVVLAFLSERPMHAYLMFQLMQQRDKGSIVSIAQRNSLYQAMNRLVKSGLAEVDSTERAENRPERTVYRITDAGTTALHQWTLELLRDETPEFPSMPVAISLMMLLSPDEVQDALTTRLAQLESTRDALVASLAAAAGMQLPRLFVLDEDYRRAVLDAQIEWLSSLLADLTSGEITWSAEWIAEVAKAFEPS